MSRSQVRRDFGGVECRHRCSSSCGMCPSCAYAEGVMVTVLAVQALTGLGFAGNPFSIDMNALWAIRTGRAQLHRVPRRRHRVPQRNLRAIADNKPSRLTTYRIKCLMTFRLLPVASHGSSRCKTWLFCIPVYQGITPRQGLHLHRRTTVIGIGGRPSSTPEDDRHRHRDKAYIGTGGRPSSTPEEVGVAI